jgi:hypothetical protein
LQLKDGANRALFVSIDLGATKPPVWKLLNLAVTITEKVPAPGTAGDVMLIDPALFVIGDRMQLEIADDHVGHVRGCGVSGMLKSCRRIASAEGRNLIDGAKIPVGRSPQRPLIE